MFVRSFIAIVIVALAAAAGFGQKTDTPQVYSWSFDSNSGYLGVQTQEVTKENFSKFGLRNVQGVAVEKVVENSPAAAAGMRDGDVIVKFNGESVTSAAKLTRLIMEVTPDHQATVTVNRGGAEQDLTVTIGKRPMPKFEDGNFSFVMPSIPDMQNFDFKFDMPEFKSLDELKDKMPELQQKLEKLKDMPQLKELDKLKFDMGDWADKFKDMPQVWSNGDNHSFVWNNGRRIGVSVNDLTDQLAQKYGVSDGLMITEVHNDSPAAKAGLKAGDIITEVNGKAVKSDIDLIKEINSQKDGDVQLTIVRDGQKQTISVTPEKTKDSGFIYRTGGDDGSGFMPQFAPLAKPAIPANPAAPGTPKVPAVSLFRGRII
ncbi:MAG: PDZ domain-containing protein [Acidobacteria bacterium]|nr:PDZ domain-containing protein [Acidobacteriota bacterium]